MTRSEAVSQIDKIITNFESFKSQNQSLISDLDTLVSDLSSINYNSINHKTTISLINGSLTKISNNIDIIGDDCVNTVKTAANDANTKMEEIASSYNSTITEESEDQTRVTFTRVDGNINKPSTLMSKGTNKSGGGSRNYNGDSSYPPVVTDAPTVTNTLDYYFAHASQEKLNSSEIEGWNDYIKEFLEENNLASFVTDITIKDGVIICKLSNDKEYKYENVTGIVDLLKQLKESILKEDLDNE